MASVGARIAEQYPFLAFLARHPEVGPLLARAVDVNRPWDPTKFEAELMKTGWWKSRSDSQRQWSITANTNPGEAKQQRGSYRLRLSNAAIKYGQHMSGAQLAYLTEVGLQRGWEPDGPEMMATFRKVLRPGGGRGDVGAAALELRAMAENDWFVKPSAASIYQTAARIVTGIDTMESANARFMAEAKQRMPHLGEQLNQGMSLRDIVDPYVNIVADELEIHPSEIDVRTNPSWRKLLGVRDMGDGKMRLPTESEVTILARDRPDWWRTRNGRAADATMATSLMQTFGKRA